MSKIVLKEYKNEKIHSLGDNRHLIRPTRIFDESKKIEDLEQSYCDTEPVQLEKRTKVRTISFSDVTFDKGTFTIKIGNGIEIENESYISMPNFYTRNIPKDLFSNFSLDILTLCFHYYESTIYNKEGNIDIDKLTLKYEGVTFKINKLDINSTEKLCSGEVTLTYEYYICPKCKEELHSEYYYEPKTKLLGMYIFDDEEHIKLSTMYKQIASNHKFAWHRYYKNMLIYKKDSGKIYSVENFNTAGSEYLKNKNKRIIKDITFACTGILNDNYQYSRKDGEVLREGHNKFVELVKKDLKRQTGDMYDYTKKDAENMVFAHRYEYIYYLQLKKKYNIKNTILAKFIYISRKYNKKTHSIIKNMTEKEIMNHFKLNTKRLKKLSDKDMIQSYLTYFDLIDDINNINTLIDNNFNVILDREGHKYKDFFYLYKKNSSEKKLVNQLLKVRIGQTYILNDTKRLFTQIKAKMKDYSVDYSREIHDLHDIFSDDYNKLRHANTPIKPNEYIEKAFEGFTVNGITYEMAKETDELIKVGAFMDICVGGYGERAVNKKCYIVIGRDANSNPVTCIELRGSNKKYHVCQVKKRRNYTPKDSEVNALTKLFKNNNIIIDTSDLKEDRYRPLKEEDSEILGKRDDFTYAVRVPRAIRRELLNEAI